MSMTILEEKFEALSAKKSSDFSGCCNALLVRALNASFSLHVTTDSGLGRSKRGSLGNTGI